MNKSKTSFFVIGILVAMLVASLITVLILYLTGGLANELVKLEFTMRPVAAKEYDGTPLMPIGYDWNSGSLKKGHTMEITPIGEQTECGSSESDLRINIYDEKGYSVNSQYAIKVNKSTLTVTPKKLTILLTAQDIPYSGQEAEINDYLVFKGTGLSGELSSFEKGELLHGDKLIVCFPGFENVGDVLPDVSEWKIENFKIYDSLGSLVTKNYELNVGMSGGGKIQIVPRKIKVNALDVEKIYDGTSVTGKFELASQLAPGHFIGKATFSDENDAEATVINAGESKFVKVSGFTVYMQDGYDVVPLSLEMQRNYEIDLDEPVYAVWSVTPRRITPRLKDHSITYGRTAYAPVAKDLIESLSIPVPAALESKANQLKEIENATKTYFEVVVDREIRNAGTYVYYVRLTADGEEVFGQGNLVCDENTARITVDPMRIKLIYNTDKLQKTYDGTEMAFELDALSIRNEESTLLEDLAVAAVNFTYKSGGDHTFGTHGVVLTNLSIVWKDDFTQDVTDNFAILSSEFNVTIEAGQFRAEYTGPLSKVYDGKEIAIANDDFVIVDTATNRTLPAFFVKDAAVKFVTETGEPDPSTVHFTAGKYHVMLENVTVALKNDPDRNLTARIDQLVVLGFDYTIDQAGVTVLSAGSEIFVIDSDFIVKDSIVTAKAQSLQYTLNWLGIISGDEIELEAGAIVYSSDESGGVNTFKVDWEKVKFYRRTEDGDREDVTNSYFVENTDCVVYIMTVMYA